MSFEHFWSLYPRKVAKLDAIKAWGQVTRKYAAEDIIAGLERNLPSLQRKDPQFIKYPASWLRAGCWMDEPEPEPLRPSPYAKRNALDAVRDLVKMQ